MTRRSALKLLGVLVACLGGKAVAGGTASIRQVPKEELDSTWAIEPRMNFYLHEDSVKEIVIERRDGYRLVIPFSDIVDALDKREIIMEGTIVEQRVND